MLREMHLATFNTLPYNDDFRRLRGKGLVKTLWNNRATMALNRSTESFDQINPLSTQGP